MGWSNFQFAVVVVRLAGLVLLFWGVPNLAQWGLYFWNSDRTGGGGWGAYGVNDVLTFLLGPVPYLVAGYLCLSRATMIAKFVVRGCFPEGCCQRCGYNLAASGLTRCPECGHAEPGTSPPQSQ